MSISVPGAWHSVTPNGTPISGIGSRVLQVNGMPVQNSYQPNQMELGLQQTANQFANQMQPNNGGSFNGMTGQIGAGLGTAAQTAMNPVQQTGNQAWVGSQPMQQSNPMNSNVLLNNTPNPMNQTQPMQSQPMNQGMGLLGNFGVNQVQNQMLNPVMQGSGKYGGQRSQKGAGQNTNSIFPNIPQSAQYLL